MVVATVYLNEIKDFQRQLQETLKQPGFATSFPNIDIFIGYEDNAFKLTCEFSHQDLPKRKPKKLSTEFKTEPAKKEAYLQYIAGFIEASVPEDYILQTRLFYVNHSFVKLQFLLKRYEDKCAI